MDLSGRIDHAPPNDELVALLGDDCRAAAEAYLGHGLDGDLRSGSMGLPPESWVAGRRKMQCSIGTTDGTNWTAATGSVRAG